MGWRRIGLFFVIILVMQIAFVFFTSQLTADESEIPASPSLTLFIIPSITQDTNTAGGKTYFRSVPHPLNEGLI